MSGRAPGEHAGRLVTAIVVTYNSADEVGTALESLGRSADGARVRLETIVIDNASTDATVTVVRETDPSASIIENTVNVGFGAANNQAFGIARGEYWLLLNPDASLDRRALSELVTFLDAHPDAAAVGPSVESAGAGAAESSGMAPSLRSMAGHFLFLNRLLPDDRGGPYRGLQLHRRRGRAARRVEWLGAMAVLLRPAAVRQVKGFDASMFMYGEDVDLGMRMDAAGWSLWVLPTARARHLVAASQGGVSTRWVDAIHGLYARRAGALRMVMFDAILAVGLGLRALAPTVGASDAGELHRRRVRAAASRAARLLQGSIARVGRHGPR
jgi:GT2 family glycosyltransferase